MWPSAFWEKLYEPLIRRSAGLGGRAASPIPTGMRKPSRIATCWSSAAARRALPPPSPPGGQGLGSFSPTTIFALGGTAQRRALRDRRTALRAMGRGCRARTRGAAQSARNCTRTTVFGVYDSGVYGALERVERSSSDPPPYQPRQRLWRIFASARCWPPARWSGRSHSAATIRPGVMLASAARTYLNRFAVACGREAVIFTTSDDGWRTAADMSGGGSQRRRRSSMRGPRSRAAVRALAGAARVHLGAVVADVRGGKACAASKCRTRDGRRSPVTADLRRGRGRLQPADRSDHASRAASRAGATTSRPSFPAERRKGMSRRGRVRRDYGARGRDLARAMRRASPRRPTHWAIFGAAGRTARGRRRTVRRHGRSGGSPESKGKAFVDFQNDVTLPTSR